MQNTKSESGSGLPRREFLKKAAGAAAVIGGSSILKPAVYGQAPSANVSGANNKIAVAVIGVGFGIGKNHLQGIHEKANENNVVVAAACDLFNKRRDWAKETAGLKDADLFTDHRKLLERKDIDAVVIATHDPWHAQLSIDAMEAGKHVYCEKPMTRYLGEAFKVYDVVKKTGKIYQVGSQGCSAEGWQKCAELINGGKLGQLVWSQGYYCRNSKEGEWNYEFEDETKKQNIEWEHWLGPVHNKPAWDTPLQTSSGSTETGPEHFHRWRKYYPYCGGLFGDLVPHRLHPLMLASGTPQFPVRVTSVGTHNVHADKEKPAPERQVREHIQLLAEFPNGYLISIICSSVNANSPGFALRTHKATLNVGSSGERVEIIPERPFAEEVDPDKLEGLVAEDIRVHEKNWFDCIRSGKAPNANIDLAIRVQTVISLAEMSDRLNTTCLFDEKARTIKDGSGKLIESITYGTLAES